MTIEDRLHDAFSAAVAALEHPDRWQEVVTRGRRRRRNRRITAVASAAIALAAVVGIAMALTGGPTTSQVKISPAHGSRTAPPTTLPGITRAAPTTATPRVAPRTPLANSSPFATGVPSRSITTAAAAPPPPRKTPSPATAPRAPHAFRGVPLYPFATQAQADAWLAAYRTTGVQPWHEDAGATALAFAAFLGYTDINKVTGSDVTAAEAHISIGYALTAFQLHTAAVIHLVRYGPSRDAPWEAVGSDDRLSFTITSPAYGSAVRSPMAAGGQITGVDESITVEVLTLSSKTPIGRTCCQPAGGTQSLWNVSVRFSAAPGQVLIVSAATGGHVAAVERFVVTGVRV